MQERSLLFPEHASFPISHSLPLAGWVALLIDGDNIQLTEQQLTWVLQEAGALGEVAVRRVYGNWAATTKTIWKPLVLRYALKPCHHIHGAPGKNATDIALTVEAMDLYYAGIRRFCFVTSDSDYTPLVQRLRASGCQVLGIGNPSKSASLLSACDRFLALTPSHQDSSKVTPTMQSRVLPQEKGKEKPANEKPGKQASEKKAPAPKKKVLPTLPPAATKLTKPLDDPLLTFAIEQAFATVVAQQGEPVLLIQVVQIIKERNPALRAKDYGKSSMLFVVKERTDLFAFRQIEKDGKLLDEMWQRTNEVEGQNTRESQREGQTSSSKGLEERPLSHGETSLSTES